MKFVQADLNDFKEIHTPSHYEVHEMSGNLTGYFSRPGPPPPKFAKIEFPQAIPCASSIAQSPQTIAPIAKAQAPKPSAKAADEKIVGVQNTA